MKTNGSGLMQDEMFLKLVITIAGPQDNDGKEKKKEVEEGPVAW